MRLVDAGGRLVEVHVRESTRARRVTVYHRPGEPAELVVPVGTSERAIDAALREHSRWIGRRVSALPPPVLDFAGVSLTEAEGRALARARVSELVRAWAPRLEVTPVRIAIRDTRSRWGSCSVRGTLSFNWRLVLAPADVLEYVVVHELCHLRVFGHPPAFWKLLESVLPTYRDELRWLRDHGWELLAYRPARAA